MSALRNARMLLSRRGLLLAILPATLIGPLSCGYVAGLRPPAGARTIGVDVFGNGTNLRNLELELTEEIARVLTNLIDLPLVPPDEADFVIRGELAAYNRRGGARDEDNLRLETGVLITIASRLVDRRTDEAVRSSVTALGTGIVIEEGIVADDTPEETEARDRAIENLATRIVLDLFLPENPSTRP